MKYISFTFDDGREDNYTYAYPIMKKYNIPGTLYCTTGFIDGTWPKDPDWYSAGSAISVDELKELAANGWELALHGDKHTTGVKDLNNASEKMAAWGFSGRPIGFSMPNSNITKEKLDAVIEAYLGAEVSYIRTGRRINTKKLSSRVLFAFIHMESNSGRTISSIMKT